MLGDTQFLVKLSPECKPSPEAVKEAGKLMEPYNEASLKAKSSAICGIYKWVRTMQKIQCLDLDTNILSFKMSFISHSSENSNAIGRYLALFVECAGFEHKNFCYFFFCLLQHAFLKHRSLKWPINDII